MTEQVVPVSELVYDRYGSGDITIPCQKEGCEHQNASLSTMVFSDLVMNGEVECNVCGTRLSIDGVAVRVVED